jgi:hypothetical protein
MSDKILREALNAAGFAVVPATPPAPDGDPSQEDDGAAQRIASEIAPELGRLIDEFLAEPPSPWRRSELTQFLWDNKVSLLRVCEALSAPQVSQPMPEVGWRVGVTRFEAGVAHATVQGAINRMYERMCKIETALRMGIQLGESGGHGDGESCPTCHFVREARKAIGW